MLPLRKKSMLIQISVKKGKILPLNVGRYLINKNRKHIIEYSISCRKLTLAATVVESRRKMIKMRVIISIYMNEHIQQKNAYLPSQCDKENCKLFKVNNIMFALKTYILYNKRHYTCVPFVYFVPR